MLIELLVIIGLTIPAEESCPGIPFKNSDSVELLELVSEFIGAETVDSAFEKTIEHKCAELETFPVDRTSVSLVEQTIFEGYAPDSDPSPDVVRRDVLVCTIHRTYTEDVLVSLQKRCGQSEHVFIKHPGVNTEIRVDFGFPVDEAHRFLEFLYSMTGKTVKGETIGSDVFVGIFEIVGTVNDQAQVIRARYKTRCGASSVTAFRLGGEGADFRIEFAPKSGC